MENTEYMIKILLYVLLGSKFLDIFLCVCATSLKLLNVLSFT